MRLPPNAEFWKAETQYRIERIQRGGPIPLGWVALAILIPAVFLVRLLLYRPLRWGLGRAWQARKPRSPSRDTTWEASL